MSAITGKLQRLTDKTDVAGSNWKAIVFWGVLAGLVLFALYYYHVEPVYGWMCSLGAWAGSTIASLTKGLNVENLGNQISEYIAKSPVIAVTGAIGLAGGALALYERSQRVRETDLKLAAQEARVYAETQSSAVTENLVYYKQQAESAAAELNAFKETNVAQQLETAKSTINALSTEKVALEKSLQEMREQFSRYNPENIAQAIKEAARAP